VSRPEPGGGPVSLDPYREDAGVIRPTIADRGRAVVADLRSWGRRLTALWRATRGVLTAVGDLGRSLARFRHAVGRLRTRRGTDAK